METLEIIVIGDAGSGKTALLNRFCSNKYVNQYKHTEALTSYEK